MQESYPHECRRFSDGEDVPPDWIELTEEEFRLLDAMTPEQRATVIQIRGLSGMEGVRQALYALRSTCDSTIDAVQKLKEAIGEWDDEEMDARRELRREGTRSNRPNRRERGRRQTRSGGARRVHRSQGR